MCAYVIYMYVYVYTNDSDRSGCTFLFFNENKLMFVCKILPVFPTLLLYYYLSINNGFIHYLITMTLRHLHLLHATNATINATNQKTVQTSNQACIQSSVSPSPTQSKPWLYFELRAILYWALNSNCLYLFLV